jgi:tRNA modification GTPase
VDRSGRCFVTVLTPEGRGAIGVIRVWGESAVEVADAVFRPARGGKLSLSPSGHLRLGRIGRGLGDEVVVVRLDDQPPVVEIQSHGGPAALGLVVEALQEAGAEVAASVRWLEHEAGSPVQAAALEDLAQATTLRTAEILLEQAQGALDSELITLIEELRRSPQAALERIDRLIGRGAVGLKLLSGWRVVIVGRPNVGKSRLLNALAGFRRTIVDPTPGTTRDAVSVHTAFDGWPVGLVDTAGLRATDDLIERSGIERAERHRQLADLVLKVIDRSEPLQPEDRALLESRERALVLASKADLAPAWEPGALGLEPGAIHTISAERGEGLDSLIAGIVARIVPKATEPGAGVPFRMEQIEALERARQSLLEGPTGPAIHNLERLLNAESPT